MEQDVVEPHGTGRAGVKQPAVQAAASNSGAEEQAARDAQLRPERESKIGDYFVRQPARNTAFPSTAPFGRN